MREDTCETSPVKLLATFFLEVAKHRHQSPIALRHRHPNQPAVRLLDQPAALPYLKIKVVGRGCFRLVPVGLAGGHRRRRHTLDRCGDRVLDLIALRILHRHFAEMRGAQPQQRRFRRQRVAAGEDLEGFGRHATEQITHDITSTGRERSSADVASPPGGHGTPRMAFIAAPGRIGRVDVREARQRRAPRRNRFADKKGQSLP